MGKSVKVGKSAEVENLSDEDGFKEAIHFLSDKFGEVSSATTAAANARYEEPVAQFDREYQLKKDADGPEVVKFLVNDDDVKKKMFQNFLKRKHLCKLPEDEWISLTGSKPTLISVPDLVCQ